MCTIQVWISAFGYTDSITSGNPFSPSTQAMKMSFTPRFCNSVSTCSQNFAPSFCAAQSPKTSLLPGAQDLHLQAVDHARHTNKRRKAERLPPFDPSSRATTRFTQIAAQPDKTG